MIIRNFKQFLGTNIMVKYNKWLEIKRFSKCLNIEQKNDLN